MTVLYVHAAVGRYGSFLGHTPPAVMMLGFSSFILLNSFFRARRIQNFLQQSPHKQGNNDGSRSRSPSVGALFARSHIPENNRMILRLFGFLLIPCTLMAIAFEHHVMAIDENYHGFGHQVFYFSFMIVGFALLLESYGRLPPDTARTVFAVVLMVEYIMLYPHALMKEDATDRTLHVYESYCGLANSLAMMYSVLHPDSIVAYLASVAILFVQGCWWVTIGFYMGGVDYIPHMIATYLGLESLLVMFVIMLVCATFLPPRSSNAPRTDSSYTNYLEDHDLEDVSEQLFAPLSAAEEMD